MAKSCFNVTIISTGTELTTGKTVDTNAPHIASTLNDHGFQINSIHILPDEKKRLLESLQLEVKNPLNDIIIITGGLGPTMDDHTINVLSELTNLKIIEDKTALRKINILIKKRKITTSQDLIKRQARVLDTSEILPNNKGLAPGIMFNFQKTTIVAMPGVPDEMKLMLKKQLLPILQSDSVHFTEYFYLYGTNETSFQEMFLSKDHDKNILEIIHKNNWGITSENGKIKIFISSINEKEFLQIKNHLLKIFPNLLLHKDAISHLHTKALRKKITIGFAESCTGGLAGKLITDLSGSSSYFNGSLVTYSNDAKIQVLNVASATIEEYGSVSKECALEMSMGAQKNLNVDYALSITGIAGPSGGTKEKPVGTVYLGFTSRQGEQKTLKLFLPLGRDRIRNYTAHISIYHLLRFIQKHSI